jgi:hypothetical protein
MVPVLVQRGEVWPDFKLAPIDSLQMLSRSFHFFLHHLFEVARPNGGSVGGNPGL